MTVSNMQQLQHSLSQKQRLLITIGSNLVMLCVACCGTGLSTIQSPMLANIGASDYFSLVTILSSIALCIMTPIAGSLGDRLGTKNVILASAIVIAISGVLLAFAKNIYLFMILRFILSLGQGGVVTGPYIIVREINPMDQVPKQMGILTGALSIGSFIGSFVSARLVDMNLIWLAIMFPIVFAIIGAPLIFFNLPQKEKNKKPFDFGGAILLAIALTSLFLALNYGPKVGWLNMAVVGGFILGLVCTIVLIIIERKSSNPLIPMQLLSNEKYTILLVIGFLSFMYLIPMNAYVPLGVQQVLGKSTTVSGLLQVPRTIVAIILPAIAGVWLAKNPARHTWLSLALATGLVFVAFAGLVFMNASMPVWFIMAMLALTGVADSFRSVSITPAAQALLKPNEIGIGTSLISFTNSLSGVIASSIFGIAYDSVAASGSITHAVDAVFWLTAAASLIGFVLVIFVYRPMAKKQS
jgi:MFS family permease